MESGSAEESIVLAVLLFALLMIIFTFVFFILPAFINNFILFKKAGKNKWSALVPVWNSYVFGVISKKPIWIVWVYIVCSLLPSLVNYGLMFTWKGYSIVYYYMFLPIIWLSFGIYIYLFISFAKQFKTNNISDIIYWLLYLFLPLVALFWTNKIEYINKDGSSGNAIDNNVYEQFNSSNTTVKPRVTQK